MRGRAGDLEARAIAVVAIAAGVLACRAEPAHTVLVPSSARLALPAAIDPGVRGASYLTALAGPLQLRWGDFLEDCRLRLSASHPLNATTLVATFELSIDKDGAIVEHTQIATSGNGDFDTAITDVLADASPLPPPPGELLSDDELAHVRWQFARDRRQAGPATARMLFVELPLLDVVERLLARGQLAHAARRVAAAVTSPDRGAAGTRVMIAALGEALDSPNGEARRTAVEACGRARVRELAGRVRSLAASDDADLRLAAITATGALGDRAAAPVLLGPLRDDLMQRSPIALARVAALAALGHARDATEVVRVVLDAGPNATALAALGIVPVPEVASRLAPWAARGDAATRGAVCQALPAAAPDAAIALIARGLRDADATVRAHCASAAAREDRDRPDPATLKRLRELTRDRDRSVRARAVFAIGRLDPGRPVRAADDPAPEVRAAYAATASEPELRALVGDRDPAVRAAALLALGDRADELAVRAAGDDAASVRRAAVSVLADRGALARLARDETTDVATAALVRLTALRSRASVTPELLDQLAAAPSGSPERARIALAWLLAS